MFNDALVDFPLQVDIDLELGLVPVMEIRKIYTVMTTYHTNSYRLEQLPAGGVVVPLSCVYTNSHLTNFLGDQHVWLLYITIGIMSKYICC
jgi:hypothetical protein